MIFMSHYDSNLQKISVTVEVTLEMLKTWYTKDSYEFREKIHTALGSQVMDSVMERFEEEKRKDRIE